MKFDIFGTKLITLHDGSIGIEQHKLIYDNMTSELTYEDGTEVPVELVRQSDRRDFSTYRHAPVITQHNPGKKSNRISTLKIQLGFSCNYSCSYCSQKFVERGDQTNVKLVEKFLSNVDTWLHDAPRRIEFWGGEPFVYWKLLKPLAESLRTKFPETRFSVITNGSLLTYDINEWLDQMGFSVAISHDGPGQYVRGPDPLEDPEQRAIILDLWNRLFKRNQISFNSMINKHNLSRMAVIDYFDQLLGTDTNYLIGEGGFIAAYDIDGLENSTMSHKDYIEFRNRTLFEIQNLKSTKFWIFYSRLNEWVNSFANKRPAGVIGQACTMDKEDVITVDLRGNVITCQNTTAASTAPNGRSHLIGHVSKLESVKLTTSTSWAARPNCSGCPVVQTCRGNCMYLEGENFATTCEAYYNDHVPFLAAAIELATGILPYEIHPHEGSLPPGREILWAETEGLQ